MLVDVLAVSEKKSFEKVKIKLSFMKISDGTCNVIMLFKYLYWCSTMNM